MPTVVSPPVTGGSSANFEALTLPLRRLEAVAMTTKLSIGDFSRMTYLSVKALRHYHDIGVLEPAEIDPASGYRFYLPSQVGLAQMIRRLRDLGMPLEEVRAILQAPDVETRDKTLVAHLQRMEEQLAQTQQTVASLRTLLQQQPEPLKVDRRTIPATPALAITERIAAADAVAWWMESFTLLHRVLSSQAAPLGGRTVRCSPPSSSRTRRAR